MFIRYRKKISFVLTEFKRASQNKIDIFSRFESFDNLTRLTEKHDIKKENIKYTIFLFQFLK